MALNSICYSLFQTASFQSMNQFLPSRKLGQDPLQKPIIPRQIQWAGASFPREGFPGTPVLGNRKLSLFFSKSAQQRAQCVVSIRYVFAMWVNKAAIKTESTVKSIGEMLHISASSYGSQAQKSTYKSSEGFYRKHVLLCLVHCSPRALITKGLVLLPNTN